MPVSTDTILEDLQTTLLNAKMCHEVWWQMIREHDDHDAFLRIMNWYDGFFNAVRISTYIAFISKLTTVFDDDERSVSLRLLFRRIEKNPHPNGRPIPELQDVFEKLWADGTKLYKYRNKNIAHRSLAQFGRDFAKETGFTLNDLKRILIESLEFVDEMIVHHRGSKDIVMSSDAGEDTLHLIRSLQELPKHQ